MVGRSVTLALCSAMGLLLMGGPASAAPSDRDPVGPFPVACDGFNLVITGISGTADRATLPNGTVINTGPLRITATNPDGESRTYNVSGPTFVSESGLVTLTGPALIIQPEEPGVIITNGRVQFPANQPIPEGGLRGRIAHDVCDELA